MFLLIFSFIIVFKENIGTYTSRNIALNAAKGSIIAFQDADDVSLPQRIEKQVFSDYS